MKEVDKEKINKCISNFKDKESLKVGAEEYIKSPQKFQKVFKKLCRRCLVISAKCVREGRAEEALSQYCPRCRKMVQDID